MPATTKLIHKLAVKIDGSSVAELDAQLSDVEVQSTLGMASSFMVRFHAQNNTSIMEHSAFKLGATVKITTEGLEDEGEGTLIEGEITSIEPFYSIEGSELVIRGYDKSHRLTLGTKQRVFVQESYSNIVSTIASSRGLTAETDAISVTPDHVFQDNQTDRDFLEMLARRHNYRLSFSDGKLQFKKIDGTSTVDIAFGDGKVIEFSPRMNVVGIVNEVTVTGWDPKTKREITGTKTSSTAQATIQSGKNGIRESSRIFGTASYKVFVPDVKDQAEAEKIAQALLDNYNSGFIQAEGVANGASEILAGKNLNVTNVGNFSGTYLVTSALHQYSDGEYKVYFTSTGAKHTQMSDMIIGSSTGLGEERQGMERSGVVPAIVTNIKDDEQDIARVKVKYPWLDDALEGYWARLTSVGVGAGKTGIHWLPQVGDEVLVAFENGDFNRPYVLGGLWNGTDKPPQVIGETLKGDKVSLRTIQTAAGNLIRFTDESGQEKIEIIDGKQKTTVTLDGAGEITGLKTSGKLTLDATGDIIIKSGGKINIEGTGDVGVKSSGGNAKVEASANLEMTGSIGKLQASGALTVKGATVAIN